MAQQASIPFLLADGITTKRFVPVAPGNNDPKSEALWVSDQYTTRPMGMREYLTQRTEKTKTGNARIVRWSITAPIIRTINGVDMIVEVVSKNGQVVVNYNLLPNEHDGFISRCANVEKSQEFMDQVLRTGYTAS